MSGLFFFIDEFVPQPSYFYDDDAFVLRYHRAIDYEILTYMPTVIGTVTPKNWTLTTVVFNPASS